MNQQLIEQEKNEMIIESIPLFEQRSIEKDRTEFNFKIDEYQDHVWLNLTVLVDGEVFLEKSRKIEQLNG